MLTVIPSTETSIISGLNSVKTSFLFSAPELWVDLWDRCASVLNNHIPQIVENWHIKIANIFSGKDEE